MAESGEDQPVAELLWHDHFTPEELARLLEVDVATVRRAARTGQLHAFIVDHRVLSIRRDDVLRWLADRV